MIVGRALHRVSRSLLRLRAAVIILLLSGCTSQLAYRDGSRLIAEGQIEAGLSQYRRAVAAEPGNARYKIALLRARDGAVVDLLSRADRALATGKQQLAAQLYQRVAEIDPANDRASAGLRLSRPTIDVNDGADTTLARLLPATENDFTVAAAPELEATYRTSISLEARDTPVRQIFDGIGRQSGLNFLYDKEVRADLLASIFLPNSTVGAAISFLLITNQLDSKVMEGNTILVYPNVPAKQAEYRETVIKTFYLANASAQTVANTLRIILKSRELVVDEKRNLLILRDTAEAVELASRLVTLQDVSEPEVMLDVEIVEVQRNRLNDLGVAWPASLSLTPLLSADGSALTLDQLRRFKSTNTKVRGIASTVTASAAEGNSETLAAPRIRVRNREKARIVIGDKLPTVTTTVSPGNGGFASESINYLDVGLTLDVEPTIYLNNEVAVRISLEVSGVLDRVTTMSGAAAYRLGTRSVATMLQLRDGENQVLAGLIRNDQRQNAGKLPVLGDVPILGRLFGRGEDNANNTELLLSITPRLVRNIQRPSAVEAEFNSGTETGFRPRRVMPRDSSIDAMSPQARRAPLTLTFESSRANSQHELSRVPPAGAAAVLHTPQEPVAMPPENIEQSQADVPAEPPAPGGDPASPETASPTPPQPVPQAVSPAAQLPQQYIPPSASQ